MFFKNALTMGLVLVTGLFCSNFTVDTRPSKVSVTGIKSKKGQILLAVFRDEKSFREEKPIAKHRFPKTALSHGALNLSVDLPQGVYGLALVDDENGNGKLDKNLIGIPKEGVAFSNFYLSGMSKPKFSDFKVEHKSTNSHVECKVRYF